MRAFATFAAVAALFASPTFAADRTPWVSTWFAAPVPVPTADATATLSNETVRQIVHTTAGGTSVRIRLSNAFGTGDLHIDKASIAQRAVASSIVAGSNVALTFGGKADVTIPAGATLVSDPVAFVAAPQSDLAVSLYVAGPAQLSTVHLQQRNAEYFAAGDMTAAETVTTLDAPATTHDWPLWLTSVEVAGGKAKSTLVTFGDSITDGAGPKADTNATWPDVLYDRLQKSRARVGIANAGASGNRVLHTAYWAPFGTAGLARFDSDVLAQPNVGSVIVLIGINDIGHPGSGAPMTDTTPPEEMEFALTQLATRAHDHGLKIYAATMTPFRNTIFKGYYTDDKEAQRQAVNAWIRSNTVFDGYVDFDKALDDPAAPGQLRAEYDSGDHLHPSAAGDAAMAAAMPVGWFR